MRSTLSSCDTAHAASGSWLSSMDGSGGAAHGDPSPAARELSTCRSGWRAGRWLPPSRRTEELGGGWSGDAGRFRAPASSDAEAGGPLRNASVSAQAADVR